MTLSTTRVPLFAVPLLSIALLAGCHPKPPSCGDEKTLTLLRQTIVDNAKKGLTYFPFNSEITGNADFQAYLNTLGIQFSNITAEGYDGDANKRSCHAQVTVDAGKTTERFQQTISYHTQLTEDHGPQNWLVQIDGGLDIIDAPARAAVNYMNARMDAANAPKTPVAGPVATTGKTDADPAKTRFGMLTVSPENVLLFNGKPTNPKVEGNNGLSIVERVMAGAQDIVLVQNNGGTACPALYTLVQLSPNNAMPSKSFGTCSDTYTITQEGNKVVVSMPPFIGPFEEPVHQTATAHKKVVFSFEDGVLRENGKPL